MSRNELIGELLKFSPQEAPAVYGLGSTLERGFVPTPDDISDAVFTLEQLAGNYPAYSAIYLGLVRAIETRFIVAGVALNPGRFCDEVENPVLRPPEFAEAREPDAEDFSEPPGGVVPQKGDPQAVLEAGAVFDVRLTTHGQVPDPDGSQEVLLEDQGPLPPPWARYAETFNFAEAAPPWASEEAAEIFSIAPEARYEERLLAANPPSRAILDMLPKSWLKPGKLPTYLLGSNPKMAEGRERCWMSAGLSLAPWVVSGISNLCPFASKGCSATCLNLSGQAEASKKSAKGGRIKRAKLLFTRETRPAFAAWLETEIALWQRYTSMDSADWPKGMRKALGWHEGDPCSGTYRLGLRMNVLSDIRWDSMPLPWPDGKLETIMARFPDIQFYDYTKNPNRILDQLNGAARWPKNYYLTFSWSEINADFAFHVLDRGGCVAMPFDTWTKSHKGMRGKLKERVVDDLPKEFCGYPVIDADTHDFRFLDHTDYAELMATYKTGVICGLRLKGRKHQETFEKNKAKERREGKPRGWYTGGFVQYSEDCGMVRGKRVGENLTNTPGYKDMLISEAQRKRALQEHEEVKVGRFTVKGFHAVPKGWGG